MLYRLKTELCLNRLSNHQNMIDIGSYHLLFVIYVENNFLFCFLCHVAATTITKLNHFVFGTSKTGFPTAIFKGVWKLFYARIIKLFNWLISLISTVYFGVSWFGKGRTQKNCYQGTSIYSIVILIMSKHNVIVMRLGGMKQFTDAYKEIHSVTSIN